ncbi:MAG: hypothetical protein ACM3VT_15235, partial [Solirubrobacterales bacterium]
MAIHACFTAVLVAALTGGMSDSSLRLEEAPLIAGDPVLADVNQVTVVVAAGETPGIERLIDAAKLKAQIWQKLRDAGLSPIEQNSESTPKLLVQIEGADVPDSDKYVYRVQTSLCRLVTVPGQGNRQIQVDVWRVRPVMAAVAEAQAGDAIVSVVLVQAGVFAEAQKAARRLPDTKKDVTPSRPTPQTVASVSGGPLVASKSG